MSRRHLGGSTEVRRSTSSLHSQAFRRSTGGASMRPHLALHGHQSFTAPHPERGGGSGLRAPRGGSRGRGGMSSNMSMSGLMANMPMGGSNGGRGPGPSMNPAMAGGAAGAPPGAHTHPGGEVENDFILLLQQQIYFLELELSLMKKNAGGSTGTASAGGMLPPDASLEDVILSLREKYIKMEAKYKDDFNDSKKNVKEAEHQIDLLRREVEYLKDHLEEREEELQTQITDMEVERNAMLEQRVFMEKKIEKLELRIEAKSNDYDNLAEKMRTMKEQYQLTQQKLQDKIEEQKQQLANITKDEGLIETEFKEVKARNLELEEKVKGTANDIYELERTIAQLKSEKLMSEQHGRREKMAKEQANAAHQRAVEHTEHLMKENTDLRQAAMKLEADLEEFKAAETIRKRAGSRWSTKLTELQTQNVRLQTEVDAFPSRLAERDTKVEALRVELAKMEGRLDTAQLKLDDVKEDISRVHVHEEKLEEANRKLEIDNAIKSEEKEKAEKEFTNLEMQVESLRKENFELQSQITDLEKKIEVSKTIDTLKLEDFKNMAKTNLKVAASIEHLLQTQDGNVDVAI